MKALFRKALLPELDSLAGTTGSVNRHPKTREEEQENMEESVTDSLAMLGAPANFGSKRGNTKQAPSSSSAGLMGLIDVDTRRTGGTKKQHAKGTTTLASGLVRCVGRPSSRNDISSTGTSTCAGDSLGNLGATKAIARTSTRRTVDESIEGGVLMSLGNLSLQSASRGPNRSNKTTLAAKVPHQPQPQQSSSQPSDSLARSSENTASGGLLGFALGTFMTHRNKNVKQSRQAVFPKQSRPGPRERRRSRSQTPSRHEIAVQSVLSKQNWQGRRERRRSRSQTPSKYEIAVPQPQPTQQGLGGFVDEPTKAKFSSRVSDGGELGALVSDAPKSKLKIFPKQSRQGRSERRRSYSQKPTKYESAVPQPQPLQQGLGAFVDEATKANLTGEVDDGGELSDLVRDAPHSKLKAVGAQQNGRAGRTKRQDALFRVHKRENAKSAPAGGLMAAFASIFVDDASSSNSKPAENDVVEEQPASIFVDDASSSNSKPEANDVVEVQPMKQTKRQEVPALMQSQQEKVLNPPTIDGLGASTAAANKGEQQKTTVSRVSRSFAKGPTKKKGAGYVANNNKKERVGVLQSPKASKRPSKRLATEVPATSPTSSGAALKRRDEKKTPSKFESVDLKQTVPGRFQSFKQPDIRKSDHKKEVQNDGVSKAAQEKSAAASPQTKADGLYSNSMSPISEVGGDGFCNDTAETPFDDTPQPRQMRSAPPIAGVKGDDWCSENVPDLVAIGSNLTSASYAETAQDEFCNDTFVDAMEIDDHLSATPKKASTPQDDTSVAKSASKEPFTDAAGTTFVSTPQPRHVRSVPPSAGVKGDDCCNDSFSDLVAIESNLPSTTYEQVYTDQDDSSITKSVSKEPSPNPPSNDPADTPQSKGVRSMSPISEAGGYSPMVTELEGTDLFSDTEDMEVQSKQESATSKPVDPCPTRETTRSRRSSRTRAQPDRFGANKGSTDDAASPQRSGIVSTLFKARTQTKSITAICRGETDDTTLKKNERGKRAATKETKQPTSSDSPCATGENVPVARRSRRARVEPNRLGDYADISDDKAIFTEAPTLPRSDAEEDKAGRRSGVGAGISDKGIRSDASEREGQNIVSRRTSRPREEPARFGERVNFTADQVETICPPEALLSSLDVGTHKNAPGFPVIERKMPCMKKPASRPESISTDSWSSLEVKKLREAQGKADSLSDTFWSDVAVHVGEKSALECRDKWFSLVQTPNPRQARKKKNATKKPPPEAVYDEDDIFNSTPMRGDLDGGAPNQGSPMKVDFGSAIKVDGTNAAAHISSKYEGASNPIDFQPRAGYKSYLQGMRRDVSRNQKENKSKKTQGKSKKGPKYLSEAVYEQDVDMNARLTPGGTLKVKSMAEGEDDDDFWGEMYGSEDGDEVDSFQ
jgi:hypothetical protein